MSTYTPAQWNVALAPDQGWQSAYATVATEAREYLKTQLAPGDLISTNTLVEALYPMRFAKGEGITARRRIYKALAAVAKHALADCCTKGEPKKFGRSAKLVRPNLWHAPRGSAITPFSKFQVVCPHCKETFEAEAIPESSFIDV